MRKKIGLSIYTKLSKLRQVLHNVKYDSTDTLEFNTTEQLDVVAKALNWFVNFQSEDDWDNIKLLYHNEFSVTLQALFENSNKVWKGIPSRYKTVDNRNVPAQTLDDLEYGTIP